MEKSKLILETVEQDIRSKYDVLMQTFEAVSAIIPEYGVLNHIDMTIITHFAPSSIEEEQSALHYIAQFLNAVNTNFKNVVSSIYSYMEGFLKNKISTMNKISRYNDFSKNHKNKHKSSVMKMIDFISLERKYSLNTSEKLMVEFINNPLRNTRNDMVHKLQKIVTINDAKDFIGNGVNIQVGLNEYLWHYSNVTEGLLSCLEEFFNFCDKAFPDSY